MSLCLALAFPASSWARDLCDGVRSGFFDSQAVPYWRVLGWCQPGVYRPSIIGMCVDGNLIGPAHIAPVYRATDVRNAIDVSLVSVVDGSVYTAFQIAPFTCTHRVATGFQISLANRTELFQGGFQLSLLNDTTHAEAGFQVALFNLSGYTAGIQIAAANLTNESFGVQLGLANVNNIARGLGVGVLNSSEDLEGMQVGFINRAGYVAGFQLGIFNTARELHGLQIGLLNFAPNSCLGAFPLLNIGF